MARQNSFFSQLKMRFDRNRLGELLVQRGQLTPAQLRLALKTQKGTHQTLGHVLRDLGFISEARVRTTLFEQMAYRGIAACLSVVIGMSCASHAHAKTPSSLSAKSQFVQTTMIHKASYGARQSHQLQAIHSYPKLFGTKEIASKDISAFTKWTTILGQLNKVSFQDSKTDYLRTLPLSEKVSAVNEYVNRTRYVEDKKNFGQSDYWATPAEFFARGGDCEDFAIAKYAMLKELGVPEDRMRLAIVQDKIKNIPHAILIVYTDEGSMVLDNQIKTTQKTTQISRYKPIYSINADGWWRHIG